ncbi:MAG: PQQ-dependent sugar dehydrogenase [Opitutaceae bacterium]|nr:PQQ-dependent sugar dehydrogenase [Opitutaceae bacterium]
MIPARRLCAALGLAASAVAAPNYECRWAPVPPVIDGRGEDAAWRDAQIVDGFRQPWLPGGPAAREGTRARLLWDREWIYFLAELDDADIANAITEHDGPMWNDDVFELFLKPSERHAGYYEFEFNPHGAIFDAFFPGPASVRNLSEVVRRERFHVDVRVAVRGTINDASDRDRGWTVEGRIPWSDFSMTGGRPVPGETWRVNLCRVNGRKPAQELSSAVPLSRPSFHLTADYAPLTFVGPPTIPRGAWTGTSLLTPPGEPPHFSTVPAWPRLAARAMVTLAPTPDGRWMWFLDQEGGWGGGMRLGRFRVDGDGSDAETLLESGDQITNIAFHPRFAENGFVFLGTNGPDEQRVRHSRLVRYTVRDGRPDPETRLVILEWPSGGHNGGGLAFGADGLLFVSSGDGTSDSDRDRVGQDPRTLRSKIMRINVDRPADGKNYSVPGDNPFVGDARFAPETWTYGMRNPWRLTFDAASGQLWSGENGQDQWEFAHLVQRGANYGWSAYEGSRRFSLSRPVGPTPVTPPTLEFSHAEFRSLTGGVVYRGRNFPELVGAFLFGDFNTGRVWAAKHDGKKVEWARELVDTPFALTHITADAAGEIVLTDYGSPRANRVAVGGVHRLVRAPARRAPSKPFPVRLSATGLFADTATLAPAAGVEPYRINAPGWHDGAEGAHHLALPAGAVIEVGREKSWEAPDGAILAQTLSLAGRRIETRVLVKAQGDWAGYTYVWDATQRDATLAEKAGADLTLAGGRAWRVPSRAECLMCHSREAMFSLTLRDGQLNSGDQLGRWEAMGLLKVEPAPRRERGGGRGGRVGRGGRGFPPEPAIDFGEQRVAAVSPLLPRAPEGLARLAAPGDSNASLDVRARSYLAVNCAHCHTVSGGGNSAMNFEWGVPAERMQALGERPEHGDFGLPDARVIAAGAAGRSVILPRMGARGPGQMPPVGSRVPDPDGVRVIAEWIQSLTP